MPQPAGVDTFNELPAGAATDRLLTCLHAPGWARSLLAGRPYPDRESLLATAYRFGAVLDDDDLAAALAQHPRIGERPTGTGRDAAHSRSEQSGVNAADAVLAERLRAGNIAYENTFGQVFLIRAAGRSGEQILAALTERLGNDPVTEAGVVRDQLAQIAQLRLGAWLDELTHTEPTHTEQEAS
ncbi:2-oxo-4-hydroxy-4-carboxy-5-ureidoimidazoline decarboxylase [Kineosporia sp. J2-2]|uniref:2-oxo-4-hydroxy-4-carboxy-5-ureidoimidazoline decarboxylase n=1 Tax=Kineosporia corallincola TaxID=2835133 RepID=A0ABS5T8V0_9ACTN|nr:2-oxo-4-hydroxy-4-carboxy-5-ureidoimidazoline decarboxylase [Kineosporia corallincola]MBT0767493.1 2-oxo-4-hydroxy-4-carboxy-5-ureidoimidazoline decarboxylase [Kineosporia corallincola]